MVKLDFLPSIAIAYTKGQLGNTGEYWGILGNTREY